MEPTGPVVEGEKQNVTLHCDVTQGNPPTLTRAKWLLDGELLRQLPDCNQTKDRPDSVITGEFGIALKASSLWTFEIIFWK